MATPKRILVLGAGELGHALLAALVAHPARPDASVLLRPTSATRVPEGVNTVHGDLAAPQAELADLLRGYDVVISASGFASGPGSQLALARAVLAAEVSWYFPWQFGVDYDVLGRGSAQPLFDEQLDVRELLRAQSRTKWTIVSTGIFTSFLFEPIFGVANLERGAVRALGSWRNEVTVTSAADIGDLTARMVLEEPAYGVVYIAGDTVTFEGLADQLDRYLGRNLKRELITIEELERQLAGDPDNVGLRYQLIWAVNKGVSWPVATTWNGRRGIEAQSLSSWIELHYSSASAAAS